MEFQEFFRQRRRMCKENTSCYKCELNKGLAGGSRGCEDFILMYPKQAEEIVQKWVAEHPEDTPVPSEDMSKTYEQGLEEAWELAIKISGHILPEDLCLCASCGYRKYCTTIVGNTDCIVKNMSGR